MKRLTIRLPDSLVAQIAAESRTRNVSKSEIVREWLTAPSVATCQLPPSFEDVAHLVGSVDGLPADLSANKKKYLKAGYGRKRSG